MAATVRATTTWNSSVEQVLQCTRCMEVQSIDQFRRYVDHDGKERWRYECKGCASKYNAQYHQTIQSLPYKKKVRDAQKARSARAFYYAHKDDPEWVKQQKERHRLYRRRLAGKYFLVVDPLLSVIREFETLHGQGSVADVTGYSNDFIRGIINGDYTVVRVDCADTILIRCNGPAFTNLYDGAKKYFPPENKASKRFLGRKIEL